MASTVWLLEAMESEIIYDLTSEGHSIEDVVDALRDVILRVQWTIDSLCLIYSRSSKQWCKGRITSAMIEEDTNEEWLMVQYGKKKKRMQRFSAYLKPPSLGDAYVLDGTLVSGITQRLRTAEDNQEMDNMAEFLEFNVKDDQLHHDIFANDITTQVN